MKEFNFKIEQIDLQSFEYPYMLKQIKSPPKKLYFTGDFGLLNEKAVAVVGSRKASNYGLWVAENLAERLVENRVVVVSGMAAGIDTAAHKGALKFQGGKTVAVLGSGIDICFPAANKNLRNEIASKGLLLSEYEPGVHPTKYTFPMRNRIISGLSLATVVAEAGNNSGALITAERAAEQGREVFAVPGNINSLNSFGSNKLIADGVTPLIFIDDIFDMLNLNKAEAHLSKTKEKLGGLEMDIFQIVANEGECSTDFIAKKLGKSVMEVNSCVSILEIKGILGSSLGKVFII